MIRLARTLDRRVLTIDGRNDGRLRDLAIEFGEAHPRIRHVVVTGPDRVVPWSAVAMFDRSRIVLRPPPAAAWPSLTEWEERDASLDLLLHRDVLDTQIVDLVGRRVSRVGDVLMVRRTDGDLEVIAAEIGARPVLRRIVPGTRWLVTPGTTVDWADLHLTSDRGHEVQLASESAALQRLDDLGLAHLLTALNIDDAADVVDRVGVRRSAAALCRAAPGVAERLLLALEPSHAGRVVEALPKPARDQLAATVSRRSALTRRRLLRFDGWRRHRPPTDVVWHNGLQ